MRVKTHHDWQVKQTRAKDYLEVSPPGKMFGFDSGTNRFKLDKIFCTQSLKFDIPGPGMYQPQPQKKICSAKAKMNSLRFNDK